MEGYRQPWNRTVNAMKKIDFSSIVEICSKPVSLVLCYTLPHFPKSAGYPLEHVWSSLRNNLCDIVIIETQFSLIPFVFQNLFCIDFLWQQIYHFLWSCSCPLLWPYPILPTLLIYLWSTNSLVPKTVHNRQWLTFFPIKIGFLSFLWVCESSS